MTIEGRSCPLTATIRIRRWKRLHGYFLDSVEWCDPDGQPSPARRRVVRGAVELTPPHYGRTSTGDLTQLRRVLESLGLDSSGDELPMPRQAAIHGLPTCSQVWQRQAALFDPVSRLVGGLFGRSGLVLTELGLHPLLGRQGITRQAVEVRLAG